MAKILTTDFFNRSTLVVAQELLGKFLVRSHDGAHIALKINEVEAYDGHKDRASHAFRGRTPRTQIMFGPAGNWYVYFVYGMHWMLNIVTGPENYPAAILIRGAGEFTGPGKLTKALNIDKTLNTQAALPHTGLWIEDRGSASAPIKIIKTPRIGVSYAGPVWSKKPYRFLMG